MITRREFLKASSLTLLYSTLPFKSLLANTEKKNHPNVVMIIADDMNDYGFYKTMPNLKMPHMDKFKKSALTFRKAYCAAPACVPSRASALSGLFPHNTGSYLNGSEPWVKEQFKNVESMVECFKRNGYNTFGRGKVFHSNPEEKRHKAMWSNEYWGGGFGPFPDKEHQDLGNFWGTQSFPDEDFPDVKNADACIDFLKQEHNEPFFMVFGLWRPHSPFTCPQRFYDMYTMDDFKVPPPGWQKDDLADVPAYAQKLAAVWGERYKLGGETNVEMWKKYLHAYCSCYSFADWSSGRVIEALDKSKYANDTIVIFWSDNGYHCGEKNHWEKTTLWEQSALTPFAIRTPKMKTAGKVCERTVNTIDIYPTLVDICNLKSPEHKLDGITLTPLLKKENAEWNTPALTEYGEGIISIRNERYRYIHYNDDTEELYDHKNDPFEHNNLADKAELKTEKEKLKKFIPANFAKSLGGKLG